MNPTNAQKYLASKWSCAIHKGRYKIKNMNLMEDGCKPKKEICRSCVHMSYHHYDKIGKCLRMVHELQFSTQE